MDAREFDVVVIGAGPVGENVADRAVRGGLTAVIVEAELVGGECSYWACMPSKALLRAGAAQRAAEAVGVVGGRVDPEKVLSRRDAFTSGWDDAGQVTWLASAGIELVRGHGRIAGERVVRVSDPDGGADEMELWARQAVVIATGSEPVIPPTPGLADAEPWTSREVTAMARVPESVAIVGGGVVAVEAATFLADLGSRVSIVARSGLLGGFDPIAGEAVRDRLRERGVDVREGAQAASVAREGGTVRVEIEGGDALGRSRRSSSRRGVGRVCATSGSGRSISRPTPSRWTTRSARTAATGCTSWATRTAARP